MSTMVSHWVSDNCEAIMEYKGREPDVSFSFHIKCIAHKRNQYGEKMQRGKKLENILHYFTKWV